VRLSSGWSTVITLYELDSPPRRLREAGEHQVETALLSDFEEPATAAEQTPPRVVGVVDKRVVHDHDLESLWPQVAEVAADALDPAVRDATFLDDVGARAVHTEHGHLVVSVDRRQVARHIALELARGLEEPPVEVVEGDVVVAGHDDGRHAEAAKEVAGGDELASPGSLGQLAADGDQRRVKDGDLGAQGADEVTVLVAEVEV
jgi:hypothetical protein